MSTRRWESRSKTTSKLALELIGVTVPNGVLSAVGVRGPDPVSGKTVSVSSRFSAVASMPVTSPQAAMTPPASASEKTVARAPTRARATRQTQRVRGLETVDRCGSG
ncbi:MAG: hypothetical protein NUW01_06830 [Gemmatimonadaceae bacterium]|nr:hypothetical protein [Gemmatimonadaceae bacterium]